jgi:hypothetical protein
MHYLDSMAALSVSIGLPIVHLHPAVTTDVASTALTGTLGKAAAVAVINAAAAMVCIFPFLPLAS